MLLILALLNRISQTYLQSLKRDLAIRGFEGILLIAPISWIGLSAVTYLLFTHQFSLPTDPGFYLFWFALVLATVVQSLLFISGLVKADFFSSNVLLNLSPVITILFAATFLGETLTWTRMLAATLGIAGVAAFFPPTNFGQHQPQAKGVLLLVSSGLLAPFNLILYKAASNHTASYSEFLSGRLIMDFVSYSIVFMLILWAWYGRSVFPRVVALLRSPSGIAFTLGTTTSNLLDSWLIFKLPLIDFSILGSISILSGYVIGTIKYRERPVKEGLLGGFLIILALAFLIV